jgi:ketosteroid isomerase-like protein
VANIGTVQKIYEALGKGDVPAILGHLSEDVEWEYGGDATGLPWLQHRRGRAQVAGFFEDLAALDIQRFQPTAFLESGNVVVVLIELEFVVRATERRVAEEDEVHIWHFDDSGKVRRFRHRLDTYRVWLASTS